MAVEQVNSTIFTTKLASLVRPIDLGFGNAISDVLSTCLSKSLDDALACIVQVGKSLGDSLWHDGASISASVVQAVLWSIYAYLMHPTNYLQCILTAIKVFQSYFGVFHM